MNESELVIDWIRMIIRKNITRIFTRGTVNLKNGLVYKLQKVTFITTDEKLYTGKIWMPKYLCVFHDTQILGYKFYTSFIKKKKERKWFWVIFLRVNQFDKIKKIFLYFDHVNKFISILEINYYFKFLLLITFWSNLVS